MGSDASKTELEKAALLRFIAAANYPIDVTSIEKLDAGGSRTKVVRQGEADLKAR